MKLLFHRELELTDWVTVVDRAQIAIDRRVDVFADVTDGTISNEEVAPADVQAAEARGLTANGNTVVIAVNAVTCRSEGCRRIVGGRR